MPIISVICVLVKMVNFAYFFYLLGHIYPVMNIFLIVGAIIVQTMLAIYKFFVSLYSRGAFSSYFAPLGSLVQGIERRFPKP